MLGKKILAAGLITEDELDQCRVEAGEEASDRTLSDLLVERHLMTDRQLERLRKEFEASKSSQKIPGYRIMKKLGAGAMASVFLADCPGTAFSDS